MANLLPATVELQIDLSGLNITMQDAKLIVLKGEPGDRDVLPEETKIAVSGEMKYSLPPYSFSVIRMKTTNN